VDVSAKFNGKVHAAWAEDRRKVLGPGLVIQPLKKLDYFEKRQEFNLWAFIMNPMMLMFIFTLVCVVVLSNIDPETLKEMQAQAQAQQNAEREAAAASRKKQ